jgi:putative membrane protein
MDTRRHLAVACIAATSFFGCGDSNRSTESNTVSTNEPSTSDGREARSTAGERLSDAQIASITSTANNGEVAQANAALPKLTKPEAKEFATMMVEMHSAAEKRQAALAQEKGITPQPNATSAKLTEESNAIVQQLGAADADEIDRLYMQKQVDVHQKVLDTIDNVLIPSATDPALKQELQTSRGEVAMHLERAKETVSKLE